MKMTIKLLKEPYIYTLFDKITVSMELPKAYLEDVKHFTELKPDTYYKCEIKPISKQKTQSQNNYAWELITLLSKAKKPYIEPIEAYRKLVRDFTTYEIIAVKPEAKDKYISVWQSNGLAWFCDILDEKETFVWIKAYYGMSAWNRQELSDFIDKIQDELREQNIPFERYIE